MRNLAQVPARRIGVIGAGASGLCAAKHLLEVGLDVTVFEIGTQVGGLWCYMNDSGRSSAYRTLHINTAKNVTNFSDFLFAQEVQRFPSHEDMYAYLKSYAEHFGVTEHIRFNSEVTELIPLFEPGKQDPKWRITTVDGDEHVFDAVCVCTGHLTKPVHVPEFRNGFTGTYMHSHDYKEPESMVGKRVWRRRDRQFRGGRRQRRLRQRQALRSGRPFRRLDRPQDGVRRGVHGPHGLVHETLDARLVAQEASRLSHLVRPRQAGTTGSAAGDRTGPTPRAAAPSSTTSPTRRIEVKHGVDRIEGRKIRFTDGTSDEFDILVAATGYLIDLPFLSEEIVPRANNRIRLWKRVIPPEWPGLYFVGMLNVVSHSNLWAYEHQGPLAAPNSSSATP